VGIIWGIIFRIGWILEKKNKNAELPKFYYVNWFRKNEKGEWLWPGFGDNIRVLKWIFEHGKGDYVDTPIGKVPTPESLDLSGLKIPPENLKEILSVEPSQWKEEVKQIEKFYSKLNPKIPKGLTKELENLKKNLM